MKTQQGQNRRLMLAAAHILAAQALSDPCRYVIMPIGKDGLVMEDWQFKGDALPDDYTDGPAYVTTLLRQIAEHAMEEHHISTISEALGEVTVVVIHDRAYDAEGDRYYAVNQAQIEELQTWLASDGRTEQRKDVDDDVSDTPNAGDLQSQPVSEIRKELKQSEELREYREKARVVQQKMESALKELKEAPLDILRFACHMARRSRKFMTGEAGKAIPAGSIVGEDLVAHCVDRARNQLVDVLDINKDDETRERQAVDTAVWSMKAFDTIAGKLSQ